MIYTIRLQQNYTYLSLDPTADDQQCNGQTLQNQKGGVADVLSENAVIKAKSRHGLLLLTSPGPVDQAKLPTTRVDVFIMMLSYTNS